jgi:hypothetical protein
LQIPPLAVHEKAGAPRARRHPGLPDFSKRPPERPRSFGGYPTWVTEERRGVLSGNALPRRAIALPLRAIASRRSGNREKARGALRARSANAIPQRAIALPKRAIASRPSGGRENARVTLRARSGNAMPRRATASPQRAIASRPSCSGEKARAALRARSGKAMPQRAIALPRRAIGLPRRAIALPQRAIAKPEPPLASRRAGDDRNFSGTSASLRKIDRPFRRFGLAANNSL